MSIISDNLKLEYDTIKGITNAEISDYNPNKEEQEAIAQVINDFRKGDLVFKTPRREFNDMALYNRMMIDQMSFNTYQPNNGQPYPADIVNAWRSNAIRPVVRNKCISIAAHATARLIYPKIFAWNEQNDEDRDSAAVMNDSMEWSGEMSNYEATMFYGVITALWSPISIIHTEYADVYRKVKRVKENGKWKAEYEKDEDLSGFHDTQVPLDEFFYENFYERDVQKQGFIIWRRVQSWSALRDKYAAYENFKYVRPGMQTIYNDANQAFYAVYDVNMKPDMCEEVLYWKKSTDQYLCIVNGVLLTDWDNPNPRNDKLYPFITFYYEPLDEGRCIAGKSLAFKLQSDANIINTLYPMIIDGTYLQVMPAMVATGGETIASDVMIPGSVTTLQDSNSTLQPVSTGANLTAGMNTLLKVDESLNESSQEPLLQGQQPKGANTAYEISRLEANSATVLGLFIKMISLFVRQYGRLRMGDIMQYMTIAQASDVSGNLVYKSFLLPDRNVGGKMKTKKIEFTDEMPEEMTEDEKLDNSYKVLEEQGGEESNSSLWKVNPRLFRNSKFLLRITADVLLPKSEDLERAFDLEAYDRAIANPMVDQEAITRDLLFGAYEKTKKNPDKYIRKQEAMPTSGLLSGIPPVGQAGQPQAKPMENKNNTAGTANEVIKKLI